MINLHTQQVTSLLYAANNMVRARRLVLVWLRDRIICTILANRSHAIPHTTVWWHLDTALTNQSWSILQGRLVAQISSNMDWNGACRWWHFYLVKKTSHRKYH